MMGGMELSKPHEGMRSVSMLESVESGLQRRLAEHEQIVVDLKRALATLEKQPELLETLNLLRKVGI